MSFTPDEDARLRAMRANGRSWDAIAERLGRAERTVRHRGAVLGLPPVGAPAKKHRAAWAAGATRKKGSNGNSTRWSAKPGAAIDLNAGLRSLEP